jgi:hypothetical protein
MMYQRFREILSLNDALLQLTAEIEEKLSGRTPFALEPMLQRVRKATMDVVMMVKDLNQLANGRYRKLYDVLGRINAELEVEYASQSQAPHGPMIIPLASLRASHAAVAGTKMAILGEVRSLGLEVPDGFVITTAAFAKLMSENELWERALQLEGFLEAFGPPALDNASRQRPLPPPFLPTWRMPSWRPLMRSQEARKSWLRFAAAPSARTLHPPMRVSITRN